MGMSLLVEVLPGHLTRSQVRVRFEELRARDRREVGEGKWTGTWKEVDQDVSFEDAEGRDLDAFRDDFGECMGKGSACAAKVRHGGALVWVLLGGAAV